MAKILVILPFSGVQFTGGLAVVNEQLVKALAEEHQVALLTFVLPERWMATQEGHGKAKIMAIDHEVTRTIQDPGKKEGITDDNRGLLYQLINSDEVILGKAVETLLGSWVPDIILGHSRFSGPAAIKLKERVFRSAKVGYFLHSYPPVEGILLSGYEAFEDYSISGEKSKQKLALETDLIKYADVVLAMGPLMRFGATLMLKKSRQHPRVHEVVSGVTIGAEPPLPVGFSGPVRFLLCGRAEAPVKGFQDILMAAFELRNSTTLKIPIHIRVRGMPPKHYVRPDRDVTYESVQEWVNGIFAGTDNDLVTVEVLPTSSEKQVILKEYADAHAVLTAAYIEHFGLVPFEALDAGRPVLVSEFSGAGQFLASRFGEEGDLCVVKDFKASQRPLTSDVLNFTEEDAFDDRPIKWAEAIADLAHTLGKRLAEAYELRKALGASYTEAHFAQSVFAAFDEHYDGMITRQVAGGKIERVPLGEQ